MDLAKELHKNIIKKFKKRRIITWGIDHIWAGDLIIMQKYERENGGYRYIFTVIDTFSKFLWLEPLQKKTGANCAQAFQKIISKSKRKPKFLHTDRGTEFVNTTFKKLLDKHKITLYHTLNDEKSSIAERVNRTVNDKLRLHFEINKNHKWLKVLPIILNEYNNKHVHRTIGTQPSKVNKQNEKEILARMFPISKFKLTKPTLKVDDRVRL